MNDGPQYTTLMDYLAVLRRQRVLVLVVVAAFTAGAYLVSSRATKTYTAEAALAVPEPAEENDQVGFAIGFRQPADQRAAISAQLVTRPSVAKRVKRQLRTDRSVGDLLSHIGVSVEARTNFLVVQATSTRPRDAALLANGFAHQFERQQTLVERKRLRSVSRAMRQQLARRYRQRDRGATNFTIVSLVDRISRTDALAEVAQPVKSVRQAAVPASPTSPKTTRNTMLGALLGLTIGILAAFGRDSLDRRMRTAQEVEQQMRLSTLTRISTQALGKALGSPNGRRSLSSRDLEAFRILRANLRSLGGDKPPRIVAVTSAMPDEGKTTVALSLAWVNAISGKKTLLVECDVRRPAAAELLGVSRAPGLVDFLSGEAKAQEIIREVPSRKMGLGRSNGRSNGGSNGGSHAASSTLWCVTAGTPAANASEMLGSDAFRDFLAVVARSYDTVILDTGPILPVVDTLQVLPLADAVIMCVRASRATRNQLDAAKATLERLGVPRVGLVVTGVRQAELRAYGYDATAPAA